MRYVFIVIALCLGWLVPPSSLAHSAQDALKSLLSLKMQTECCVTRRAYLKAYEKTRVQIERFLKSSQRNNCTELSAILVDIMKHYERVVTIMSYKSEGFICAPREIEKYQKLYPTLGGNSDHKSAMVIGPQGKKCLADSLLIDIIFRQAAWDFRAHGLLPQLKRNRFKCLSIEP
ncbi:MAG: hypothetical protein C4575_07995 [Desulforudis sp.]|jgi:hypothetical protein|nr:MAG: hypothetical protein C4575_07995 [Desulforudis sp.]